MLQALLLMAAVAGGDWSSLGTTDKRATLVHGLASKTEPFLVLKCENTSIHVHLRAFQARNAWPQPPVAFAVGDVVRRGRPDVRTIGNQTAFEISFDISDAILDPLAKGRPLSAKFDGETRAFAPIPKQLRDDFVRRCGGLVPSGMRATTSEDVY
jgi:hypothetical protein